MNNSTAPARFYGRLAYLGTRYQGFQRQRPEVLTIQSEVERALQAVTGQQVAVVGAGRTDSGVHALGQVIAFEVAWPHDTQALWRALNANLPQDIALRDLSLAPSGFHPRYSAQSRTYLYQFYSAPVRRPLWDTTAWHVVGQPLRLDAMQQAAQSLLGTHDFATFGAPTLGRSTVRHMVKVQCRLGRHGLHRFVFCANGFLQHMVRGLMGSLVEVGRGKWTVADFQAALQAQDRHACGPLAPPQGLILWRVTYPSSSRERQAEVEPHETQNMDS